MHVHVSVTAGSVNPAAIYVVRTIYTPTNNDVPIQYHPHTSPPLSFIHLYSPQTPMLSVTAGSVNPAAIYVVCTIYTPTNNDVAIQYHPKNLIPLGGDTPFYLISRRNRRFLFDG